MRDFLTYLLCLAALAVLVMVGLRAWDLEDAARQQALAEWRAR